MFFIVNDRKFFMKHLVLSHFLKEKKNSQIQLYVTIMSRTRLRVNLPVWPVWLSIRLPTK